MNEEVKNEDVFAEAEEVTEEEVKPVLVEKPAEENSEEMVEAPHDSSEDDLIDDDFTPQISEKSQQEVEEESGVKKEMNNKVLTIESIEILKPKTKKKDEDGNIVAIDPQLTQKNANPFYSTKLKIRFAEDNLVEYYPTVRVWVNDGQLNPNVRLDRIGHSKVSQLTRLALQAMSNNAFALTDAVVNERPTNVVVASDEDKFNAFSKVTSDRQILDWMTGRKVKIKTSKGNYQGNPWFRNDIVGFEK